MNRLSWLKYLIGGACTLGLVIFSFTMLHLYRNATRSDAVMDKLDRAGLLMELSKKDVELAELKARLAMLTAAGDPQKSIASAPVAPSASSTPLPQARPAMSRMNRDDLDKLPTSALIKRWQDGGDDPDRFLLFVKICLRDDLPVDFLLDRLRSAPDPLSREDLVVSNLATVIKALERMDLAGKHPVRPEVMPFLTSRDLPVRKAARTYLVSVGGDAMLDRWFEEIRKIRDLGTDSARAEVSDSVAEVVLRGWMTAERICLHREYPLIADIEQELARKDLGKYFVNEDHPSDAANRLKSYHAAESEYDRRSALEHYARNPGSDPATIRQLLRQEIERQWRSLSQRSPIGMFARSRFAASRTPFFCISC